MPVLFWNPLSEAPPQIKFKRFLISPPENGLFSLDVIVLMLSRSVVHGIVALIFTWQPIGGLGCHMQLQEERTSLGSTTNIKDKSTLLLLAE